MKTNKQLLNVSSITNNTQSYTNCIYLHPSHKSKLKQLQACNYYIISHSQHFFNVQFDDKLDPHQIGINKLQRIFLEVSVAQNIEIEPITSLTSISHDPSILYMSIQVECLTQTNLEVEAIELEKIFKDKFQKFLLSLHAPLILDYKGNLLVFRVTSIKTPRTIQSMKTTRTSQIEENSNSKIDHKTETVDKANSDELLEETKEGFLSSKTELVFTAAPQQTGKGTIKIKQDENSRRDIFSTSLTFEQLGIGGLNKELAAIIRRAFVSRTFSAEMIEKLGLQHVKGLLLYGPPGTGKTLIARQIGKMLRCKSLKVVNGPEVLNKYVGASEENVRQLFVEAEDDFKSNGENAELHIIIFDEIDAICKQRGTVGGGTGVNDTVVNQLLSKMDGINALNNILIIGMTNRKDMIDSALLRPGRFEVHIEIGLPDEAGRKSIFQIHTKRLRENGLLNKNVDIDVLAQITKNYSGAEIQGVVKCAVSFASFETMDFSTTGNRTAKQQKSFKDKNRDKTLINVTMNHLLSAIEEVKPSFGAETQSIASSLKNSFYFYSDDFTKLYKNNLNLTLQIKKSTKNSKLSILVEGDRYAGTTSFVAKIALEAGFEYTKMIRPDDFVGCSEGVICYKIKQIFEDSYKSPKSLIILDQLESLLGYVPIGPRFLNTVLQTLSILVKKYPPELEGKEPRKLVILATTSKSDFISQLGLKENFDIVQFLPNIKEKEDCRNILKEYSPETTEENIEHIIRGFDKTPTGIKKLLMLFEMSKNEKGMIEYGDFVQKRLNMNI